MTDTTDLTAVEEVMATAVKIVFGVILPALGELMVATIKSGITAEDVCKLADLSAMLDDFYTDEDGTTH